MDKAIALADWKGFDARAADAQTRGRLRGRGMATFLEWTGRRRLRGARDGHRERRRRTASDRDLLGDCRRWGRGSRRRSRSWRSTSSACRSTRSGSCKATPTAAPDSAAPARARCSSAALRCASPPSGRSTRRSSWRPKELEAAAADIEYRDGVFSIAGTDRRIGLFELARKQPSRRIVLDSTSSVAGRDVAQRLPHLRSRSRSRTPARSRSPPTGRSTTSAASSIR